MDVDKERESKLTGIAEQDLLWLERVMGITDQVLGDLDQLEHNGVKVFLDLLQKNSLFGTSLNKEVTELYNLLVNYRTAKDDNGQEQIKKKINDHATRIHNILSDGIAVLKKTQEMTTHFLEEEELLEATAESFCRTQLNNTEQRKIRSIKVKITRVLQETRTLLDNILKEFQSIYDSIEKTLWPAITYTLESKQKISLEGMINHIGRLHMRIKGLADSVKKERALLEEEKQYDKQLQRITVELISMTKQQATRQGVLQRIRNIK